MYLTFSQKWAKQKFEKRIRALFDFVKTRSTPDLWLKVFFYRNKTYYSNQYKAVVSQEARQANGHYRGVFAKHGFYDKEWDFIRKHSKIDHCITLKIGESCSDKDIIGLMAHEFAHYLHHRKGKPKRHFRHEVRAEKWAKKRIENLKKREVPHGINF